MAVKRRALMLLVTALAVVGMMLIPEVVLAKDGHEHNDVNFGTAWTKEGSLPDASGSYYLTKDVALSDTWEVSGTGTKIDLCLNGHSITNAGYGRVIYIKSGATLNLYDCDETTHNYTVDQDGLATVNDNISDGNAKTFTGGYVTGGTDSGVCVNGGSFNMYGSTIIGNKASYGGGVSVYTNSNFNLFGGAITGNAASGGGGGMHVTGSGSKFALKGGTISGNTAQGYGGGVKVDYNGEISQSDGTITDNTADHGGGVFVDQDGAFQQSGGIISGNSANYGGGVYVETNSSFTLSDGIITGNTTTGSNGKGGGVVVSGGSFSVSGNPIITDNTQVGDTGEKIDGNVFLYNGRKITIGDAKLKDSAKIGVSMYTFGVFTEGLNGKGKVSSFISDSDQFAVLSTDDGEAQLVTKEGKHVHDYAKFVAWEETDSLPTTSGSYYLDKDVVLSNCAWEVSGTGIKIDLCLNGHSITRTGDNKGSIIAVSDSATLNLYDCDKTDHSYTISDMNLAVVDNEVTEGHSIFKGGYITGGEAQYGGAVYINGDGKFNMYGGTIIGNKADIGGGGVHINNGTFNLYNGSIIGNTSERSGGGVFVESRNTFTMTGGEVFENTAKGGGGGVYAGWKGNFYLSGGLISGNIAESDGGGVNVYNEGTFRMSQNAEITNNTAKYGGGVSIGESTEFIMSGNGTITGNTAQKRGGGVYYHYGDFKLSGTPTITGNTKGIEGAKRADNVWFGSSRKITISGILTNTEKIGITLYRPGTFTSGWSEDMGGADPADFFTSDNKDGEIKTDSQSNNTEAKLAYRTHRHGETEFEAWPTSGTLPDRTGNYYLIDDVERSFAWRVSGTVSLCLNGYSITSTSDQSSISIPSGATLNLYECDETEHKYTMDVNGRAIINDATKEENARTFKGGYITGVNKVNNGGGVYVDGNGTFNMYGATMIGNMAENGGGVYISSGTTVGTFNMYGGTIIGNKAWDGGGVYISDGSGAEGGVFNMYGGDITNNTVTSRGGGVLMMSSAKFKMEDGGITDNTANAKGGGVYVSNGSFKLSDGAITNNTAKEGGGGVYVAESGAFEQSDGLITGNKTKFGSGGGVYVTNSTYTMSGTPAITGNTQGGGTDEKTSNVSLNGSTITLNGGLNEGASIGVSMSTPGVFTTGWKDHKGVANPADFFSSDDEKYGVTLAPEVEARLAEEISATVTFKVANGAWDDNTSADKAVTLTGYEGDTLKLTANQIPAVGSKPNTGYEAGSWDTVPSKDTAITEDMTYTYTYKKKAASAQTNKPQPAPTPIDPASQMGSDGTALGAGASQVAAEKVILQLKSEKDPVGSRFGILQVGSSKQGNTNIMLTWKKAKGAKKYAVYGIICGKNKMQKLATVSKNKYNVKKAGKKLAKGNYYKFMVVALDQNNNVVSTSKITHIATKGVVKGVKKGKTKVFVYAQNGACKIITVKVK